MASKKLALRRPDCCSSCGADLPVGTLAWWDGEARTVTCGSCAETSADPSDPPPAAVEDVPSPAPGSAGNSARRQHQRRKENREGRIRARHPVIGKAVVRVSSAPAHERVWLQGAEAEERVAAMFELRLGHRVLLLHDRRMPGGRGNIDHIAVARGGVWVIDTKSHHGKVATVGGLRIAGRRQPKLVEGLRRQQAAVRAVIAADDIPLNAAFCMTDANIRLGFLDLGVPLIGTTKVDGIPLLYARVLVRRLAKDGPLDGNRQRDLHRKLAQAFPPA